MDKILIFAALALLCAQSGLAQEGPSVQGVPKVAAGRVERMADFPSRHVPARHVDVWLPDGYDTSSAYKVLYLHDGQMLFDGTTTWNGQEWGVDETVQRLLDEDSIAACIVVGIWNAGPARHSEYFPQKPYELLPLAYRDSMVQSAKRSGQAFYFERDIYSDDYLRFIVQELKPHIDSAYATHKGAEHTAIMGSSMGGLISMYALCEYPDVFGSAGCLSTHWIGLGPGTDGRIPAAFQAYLAAHLPPVGSHKLYFDHGTEALDAYYAPHQQAVDELLRQKGYGAEQVLSLRFEGEDHSERAWRKRLAVPLQFLLGR